jgi:anti-anti-sigma regulatory factor
MDLRDGQSSVGLDVDSVGGVLGIGVHGKLVGEGSEPLRECLAQAMRGARPVVLDLTEVTAIDGEAVALLLEAHRRLATRLRLVAPRGGPVHQALRREGVAHVLSLHASRAEALAAAGRR